MEKRKRWNKTAAVALAGDLADADGLETLTLTKLAQVMGIRPPSLFNHVDSLAGLIREVALTALADLGYRLGAALEVPGSPQESLARMLEAYRRYVKDHPGRYAATLALPAVQAKTDPEWAALDGLVVEKCLGLTARFGLEGAAAIHTLRGWRALAHGFSDLERRGGFGIPLDCDESFRLAVQTLVPVQQ